MHALKCILKLQSFATSTQNNFLAISRNHAYALSQMWSRQLLRREESIITQVSSVISPCVVIKGGTAGRVPTCYLTTQLVKAFNQLFKRLREDLLFNRDCTKQTYMLISTDIQHQGSILQVCKKSRSQSLARRLD